MRKKKTFIFSLQSFDKLEFNHDANFLGTIYSYLLQGTIINKFNKVNIIVTNNDNIDIAIRGEKTNVCNIYIHVDYEKYFKLKESERPKKLLDIIDLGVDYLSREMGWDIELFRQISKQLIRSNYKIKIPLLDKLNKKNGINAKFYVTTQMHQNDFYLDFYDNEKELCCNLFYKGTSSYIYWNQLFYDFYWQDDSIFCIEDELKELQFIFDKGNCSFKVVSMINDDKRKEKKLKLWAYDTAPNNRVNIYNELGTP